MPISDEKPNPKLQRAIDLATKELNDKGMLIEAGYAALVLTTDGRISNRDAFFAGAQHLFSCILRHLDSGPWDQEPSADEMRRLELIDNELKKWVNETKQSGILKRKEVKP